MDLALAMSPTGACLVVLVLTGVAAPLLGLLLRHIVGGWETIGGGPFAIEQRLPPVRGGFGRVEPAVDPAIQAAEVRQMLRAKSERRQRRGEAPLDVEAETTRLLAPSEPALSGGARQGAELRAEVRQLVVTRNERRMRRGLEPLDVEAETDRQLVDFVGSD